MRKELFLTFLVLSSCQINLGGNPAAAERIRPTPPANYPPAGYKGSEFRDNRGCVYILVDTGSQKNWVPRVNVNGSAICGAQSADYTVGPGVQDIHGTITAPKPVQSNNTAQVQQTGGILGVVSGLFGGGQPAPTPTPAPVQAPSTGQEIIIYEDQINTVPGAQISTGQVDVINVPKPTPAPVPQPVQTPVPVQTQQPTQNFVAPAPVANPNLAVQIGTFNFARGAEVQRILTGLGYRVNTVNLGASEVVQVLPQAGQSTQALQAAMRAMGFKEAILVSILH